MNNQLILQSIASDLKRVALSLHRGSPATAARFTQEAIKRKTELNISSFAPYIQKLITRLEQAAADPETALMYSTLFQNYALRRSQTANSQLPTHQH